MLSVQWLYAKSDHFLLQSALVRNSAHWFWLEKSCKSLVRKCWNPVEMYLKDFSLQAVFFKVLRTFWRTSVVEVHCECLASLMCFMVMLNLFVLFLWIRKSFVALTKHLGKVHFGSWSFYYFIIHPSLLYHYFYIHHSHRHTLTFIND